MSGMMNGAPYYSAPHRHQKSYILRLGTMAEDVFKPELAELPELVAAAIRRGLIKRPDPSTTIPTPIAKVGPLAAWQTIACTDCGQMFERRQRKLTTCTFCRIPIIACKNCKIEFRPADRKKVCCSKECSKALQSATFKTKHGSKAPKLTQCVVCLEMKPVRQAGSGVAKTCSPTCADSYRKNMNQIRFKKK